MLRDQSSRVQDNKIEETKMTNLIETKTSGRPDETIVVTSSREHQSMLKRWPAPCKRPDLSSWLDDEMTTYDLETWVPEDMRISDQEAESWVDKLRAMSEEERVYVLEYLEWMSIMERREVVSYPRVELERMGLWGSMVLYCFDHQLPVEELPLSELQEIVRQLHEAELQG